MISKAGVVDVGAANNKTNALPGERLPQRSCQCSKGCCCCRFDGQFHPLEDHEHGILQRCIRHHRYLPHKISDEGEGVGHVQWRAQAVSNGIHSDRGHGRPLGQTLAHASGAFGLHTVYRGSRSSLIKACGDTSDQSATPYRDDHRIQRRSKLCCLTGEFDTQRGASGHCLEPIKGMNDGTAFLIADAGHFSEGFLDVVGQDNCRSKFPTLANSVWIGGLVHHHLGLDAQCLGGVGHRNGVISGADRCDSCPALDVIKGRHVAERAAGLETAGFLEQFEFQNNTGFASHQRILRIPGPFENWGFDHPRRDGRLRLVNVIEGKRSSSHKYLVIRR